MLWPLLSLHTPCLKGHGYTCGFNYDLQACNSQICLPSPDFSPKFQLFYFQIPTETTNSTCLKLSTRSLSTSFCLSWYFINGLSINGIILLPALMLERSGLVLTLPFPSSPRLKSVHKFCRFFYCKFSCTCSFPFPLPPP